MALIIEDGSNVANANSVATVVELRAYAALRGDTVPTADGDCEVILIQGMDYINSIEDKLQGYRYYYADGQSLCLPRGDIKEFGRYVGGEIIQRMKDAQCQLAVDASSNDLLAPGDGREVVEKKVGPLTTKWNAGGSTATHYSPTAAIAILEPLFKAGASSSINLLAYR